MAVTWASRNESHIVVGMSSEYWCLIDCKNQWIATWLLGLQMSWAHRQNSWQISYSASHFNVEPSMHGASTWNCWFWWKFCSKVSVSIRYGWNNYVLVFLQLVLVFGMIINKCTWFPIKSRPSVHIVLIKSREVLGSYFCMHVISGILHFNKGCTSSKARPGPAGALPCLKYIAPQ